MRKNYHVKVSAIMFLMLALSFCFTGCGGSNVDAAETSAEISSSEDNKLVWTTQEEPGQEEIKDEPETEKKTEPEITTDEETLGIESREVLDVALPSNSGRLHVDGTNICNENNEIIQLKGLSTHGLAWFPGYVNNALFSEFRNNWNCNVIRLAMYTDEYGGYCNGGDKKQLRQLIDDGVKYATDNDMYVIIDWHILADGNPNTHKSEALKFFDDVSSSYADYNNVIYEICNEPNGGTDWKSVKSYAEEVIPVIRKNDKNAIIIVGTPTWSQEVDKAAGDPITGYDNIMYALHFYADTHRDDLRNKMVSAINAGLPIFVTEYGICDASGNGAINYDEAGKWMDLLDKNNISSCAWNISNKGETSAIFKTSVSKYSGFTENDLSASGKWLFEMLNGNYESGSSSNIKTESESNIAIDSKIVTNSAGELSYTVKEVNSWEDSDGTHYQYELIVLNKGADITGWTITIPFSGNIKLDQGWCAEYSASGNTLTVKNESYNGALSQDAETKDIGFIVIGDSGLEVK